MCTHCSLVSCVALGIFYNENELLFAYCINLHEAEPDMVVLSCILMSPEWQAVSIHTVAVCVIGPESSASLLHGYTIGHSPLLAAYPCNDSCVVVH